MSELDISPHAMEQFQSRWWLATGDLIPWSEVAMAIESLLQQVRGRVFPANGAGVVEYRAKEWAFVIDQGVNPMRMITAKLRMTNETVWSCPRRINPAVVYIYNEKGKEGLVTHLQWRASNSTYALGFNPWVSLREILYALRSFGCRISKESDWAEVWGNDWVAIPIYLPAQPLVLEVVRQLKGEMAVAPARRKYGRQAMVVSNMGGQYERFQVFLSDIIGK